MHDNDPARPGATSSPVTGPEDVRLTVGLRAEDGAVVLSPVGELDYDSAHVLRAQLDEALARAAGRIVLDCGRLSFCDSTGLNLLLATRLEALKAELSLVLVRVSGPVARLLELTGTDAVFDIRPDLAPTATG
ncbi:STAS domain-containing protein [Kitasatospora terrestris]|uniref:Anti-sigma factor antagonist n=1 Tax=Kitasatospora terrestris TaxID=258051 RepID=A0ABP9EI63_9ACTN